MKHILLSTLIIGLVLLLAACGASEPLATPIPVAQTSEPPVVSPSPTETSLPPAATLSPTKTPAPAKPLNKVVIPAPALANNLLGDPAEREIAIYLPPSYNSSNKRYPVVYYLSGYGEGLNDAYILSGLMKKMLEAGTVKEMMWVVVSGQNSLGGSFYVNSPVTGNWEDFIISDVVDYVDKNYRTITTEQARGIAGFSMGGFGALNLAMRHPDMFGAVYALSPGLFAPDGLAKSQMFAHQSEIDSFLGLEKELAALPPEEAQAQFVSLAKQGNNLLFAVAYGVAFSPNSTKNAPYLDYPYQGNSAQPDNEIWKKWESGYGGVTEKIKLYKENLLKLNGILVDYGTNDPYHWIPEGCQFFAQQLAVENIPHQLMSFEGGHGPLSGRAEAVVLPFFSTKLVFEVDKQ